MHIPGRLGLFFFFFRYVYRHAHTWASWTVHEFSLSLSLESLKLHMHIPWRLATVPKRRGERGKRRETERCIYLGVLRLFPQKIQLSVELERHIHRHLVVLFCQGLVFQHIFTQTRTHTQSILMGIAFARLIFCFYVRTHSTRHAHACTPQTYVHWQNTLFLACKSRMSYSSFPMRSWRAEGRGVRRGGGGHWGGVRDIPDIPGHNGDRLEGEGSETKTYR
jgi:hypothetical protein